MNAVDEAVQAHLSTILDFHRKQGRQIAKYFRCSRKGREGIVDLERFGVPIPDDLRALYHDHDGVDPALMHFRTTQVFGDFDWLDTHTLQISNRMSRVRSTFPLSDTLFVFRSPDGLCLDCAPALADQGKCPLVANLGPLSAERFIAFDSILDMLRTVAAACEAGLFRFDDDQTRYDKRAFADLVQRFNQRDVFWRAYANDAINWDEIRPSPRPPAFSPEEKQVFSDIIGEQED